MYLLKQSIMGARLQLMSPNIGKTFFFSFDQTVEAHVIGSKSLGILRSSKVISYMYLFYVLATS